MSKTVSEAAYALREFLKNSVLFTDAKKPNGILAYDRLNNSELEDTIIEPLAMQVNQLQEGVLNVNIFVPNLSLNFGGKIDRSQRDAARIKVLERLALNALESDNVFGFDYNFNLQQVNVFEDSDDWHYINLRVEYTAINL